MLETLEMRRHLSSTGLEPTVVKGTLQIPGSGGDEIAIVTKQDKYIKVEFEYDSIAMPSGLSYNNSSTKSFLLSKIKAISAKLLGGDDRFENRTNIPSNVLAGAGDDTLISGTGADVINGGAGDDTVFFICGGSTVLKGNAIPASRGDTLKGIETLGVMGGSANDRIDARGWTGKPLILMGEAGDDTLLGPAKGSVLDGGSGNDLVVGGKGDDTLTGGGGNNTVRGGNGYDELDEDVSGHIVLTLGQLSGEDHVAFQSVIRGRN